VGLVSWRARESADELDATTAADAGYAHPDTGVLGLTVEISGVMDLTSGDYTPIRAGTAITTLKLYRDIDVTEAFLIGSAVVIESSQGGSIRERFEISATIKSVGSYTYNDPA
jgi:hypothetical protein